MGGGYAAGVKPLGYRQFFDIISQLLWVHAHMVAPVAVDTIGSGARLTVDWAATTVLCLNLWRTP